MSNFNFQSNNVKVDKLSLNNINNNMIDFSNSIVQMYPDDEIPDYNVIQEEDSIDYSNIPDTVIEFCEKYGIPKKYYDSINELYEELNDTYRPRKVLKQWVGKKIEEWKDEPDMSIAELFNNILNNNNSGLQFNFTDKFLEDNYEWLISNFVDLSEKDGKPSIEFDLFDRLDSENPERRLKAISKLLKKIKNCNISYDELEKQIPGITDYIFDSINIDGIVKDRKKLADFWNSLAFYGTKYDVWDNIALKEKEDKYPNFGNALMDLYPDLERIVKDYFFDYGIYLTDTQTRRFIRKIAGKLIRDNSDDFIEDYFEIVDALGDEEFYSALKLLKDFEDEYNIELDNYGIDVKSIVGLVFYQEYLEDIFG